MLEKRETFLQTKIDNELKIAKANATKNRRGTYTSVILSCRSLCVAKYSFCLTPLSFFYQEVSPLLGRRAWHGVIWSLFPLISYTTHDPRTDTAHYLELVGLEDSLSPLHCTSQQKQWITRNSVQPNDTTQTNRLTQLPLSLFLCSTTRSTGAPQKDDTQSVSKKTKTDATFFLFSVAGATHFLSTSHSRLDGIKAQEAV